MASYLVDLILLVALLFTSIRVTKMHRELVRLRTCQGDFAFVLGKTNDAVDDMTTLVREFSADGRQLVLTLGDKIDEARQAIMDIEARSDPAQAPARAAVRCADGDGAELLRGNSKLHSH
ncbi:hypothetical protein MXD81_02975 [Microbacteriaceae bacterium K1510]|nr:hypothetical protein [Microbacteriaceae bacterium K1510]